ncbi:MAG: hypothetical protein V4714_08310 [Bacteroidota bacterium]
MIVEIVKIVIPVLVFGSAKAIWNYHQIGKGLGVQHFWEWIIWALLFIATDWLFELKWAALPLQSSLSFVYFEMLLNSLRGLHLFKVGETFWLDKLLRKLPNHEVSVLTLKIILTIITALLYTYAK